MTYGELTSGQCEPISQDGGLEPLDAPPGAPVDASHDAPDGSGLPGIMADASVDAGQGCGPPIFGPAASNASGGQRVMDSQGFLYITSYWDMAGSGTFGRVPPGGGTVEVLKTSMTDFGGTYAWAGEPYVLDDDTVLVSANSGIVHYEPTSGTIAPYNAGTTNGFGFSVVVDASKRILATGMSPDFFEPSAAGRQVGTFASSYATIFGGWLYAVEGSSVEQRCLDGVTVAPVRSWTTTDAYGAAIGADGDLYVTQGNTSSPGVYRVDLSGGSVTLVATIPGYDGAGYLAADTAGMLYVVPWPGHTVWRVNPATGARFVYGCETGGAACGSM